MSMKIIILAFEFYLLNSTCILLKNLCQHYHPVIQILHLQKVFPEDKFNNKEKFNH